MRITRFSTPIVSSNVTSLLGLFCISIVAAIVFPVYAQDGKHLEQERERGLQMPMATRDLIKSEYYDPSYNGIDLELA